MLVVEEAFWLAYIYFWGFAQEISSKIRVVFAI
jgi:hypothetical protein